MFCITGQPKVFRYHAQNYQDIAVDSNSWMQEELERRRGLQSQPSLADVENAEVCAGETRKTTIAKGHGGEDELLVGNYNLQEEDTIVALLKACAKRKDLHRGSRIHADILNRGLLEKNTYLGNNLVNLYAKCGALAKAQEVFDELQVRDVVSWNVLISGYAQHGHGEEALACFKEMLREGLSPDAVTFVCILKACGSIRAADKGKEIHAHIVKEGLLGRNVQVGTALVDMYAKCGLLAKAQGVFDELRVRNVVSWTVLISGYVDCGHYEKALTCYERMHREGVSPDALTFVCILKACSSVRAADKGKEIHAEIVRGGLLGKNIMVGTALVDMYAKCGALALAQEVFDKLRVRDVVSWNALIAGYTQQGYGEEALNCFDRMQRGGFSPTSVTFVCILKACGSVGAADKGKILHAEIVKEGLGKDILIGTALVDMYVKCGAPEKAQEVFDELPTRDVVTWNVLIAGYAQHGHGGEALNCFEKMRSEGLSPDTNTYACILKACGSIGASDKGKEIHAEIARVGLLEHDFRVGNALMDMYTKFGAFEKTQEVFNKLGVQDVVSWTALIAAYAQAGKDDMVFDSFDKMVGGGIEPNLITFAVILRVCSHAGLLEKGQVYFDTMSKSYGIKPALEHYSCMVDLFGRAGHFDKAVEVIKRVPTSDHLPIWSALLSACRKWGNVDLGRWAFEHAVILDEKDASLYVCMNNIYAAAAMQEDADKINAMRVKNEAWKINDFAG